jgi:thermitase
MNRQNFLGHLALALTIVLIAAFAGQLRRWERNRSDVNRRSHNEKAEIMRVLKPNLRATSMPEVLVRFRDGTSESAIRQIAAQHNDAVEDEIESVNGLTAIDDLDDADPQSVADEYSKMTDEVEYAEVNYVISLDPEIVDSNNNSASEKSKKFPPGQLNVGPEVGNSSNRSTREESSESPSRNMPDDPMFAEQWSLANSGQRGGRAKADINALLAWDKKGTGSDEVIVAVLDSGVDYRHPDLASNMWERSDNVAEYFDDQLGYVNDQYGFDATDVNGDPMDENGHGTHCAGIIGADGNNGYGIAGINWRVKIMPLKFMSKGGFGSTKDAIEAINYVINRKKAGVNVRIISASWGSTQKSKALEDVIRAAGDAGILFVAASGNASANADRSPHYPASFDLPNVISVAALNRNDELASFSNFGAKRVHIAAPGAEILSTWLNKEFREASGTSMATPEVAGVAALVLASEPKLTMEDVRARLLKSVDKLPALSGKVSSGGRINAARAVGAE